MLFGYTDPGSCLETFNPIPFIECGNPNACDYFTGGDYAMWLTTFNSDQSTMNGISNIAKYIGRCTVCSK